MSKRWIWAAIPVAALLVLGAVAWLIWRDVHRRVDAATAVREEAIPLTALVTRVRDLNRLETATMRVVHVSTVKQDYQLVPDALAGDELTFFATGDVIAGVDMAQFTTSDVSRDADGTVVLRLPPPQILVSRLDNRESRVISRKTGLLRRADIHMESRARQYAEAGIRNEALHRGILLLASQNAEAKIAGFLQTLGVKRARFEQRTGGSEQRSGGQ